MPSGNPGVKRPPFTVEHRKNISLGGIGRILWNKGKKYALTRLQKFELMAGRKRPENCEICGISNNQFKRGLHYDHNHITGKFRGWICHNCNTAIGLLKEDPNLISLAAQYVRLHQK